MAKKIVAKFYKVQYVHKPGVVGCAFAFASGVCFTQEFAKLDDI